MKCSIEDCDNPCEGNTLLCASHNYENREAEREAKKVKVVKPVKKVSENRAKTSIDRFMSFVMPEPNSGLLDMDRIFRPRGIWTIYA